MTIRRSVMGLALTLLAVAGPAASSEALLEVQKLVAFEPENSSSVGWSVAVDGDTLVLGAPVNVFASSAPGSAYVFERVPGGPWTEVARLAPPGAGEEAQLGYSVAIDGEVLVLGEPFRNLGAQEAGAAHVYERDPITGVWEFSETLRASDFAREDRFGSAVAVAETTIVIGSPEDDDQGDRSGSVYIFDRDAGSGAWLETTKLTASDGESLDVFGTSVGISGEVIAVGTPFSDEFGFLSGNVYVFERDAGSGSWIESETLLASDGSTGDWFGVSLAIEDSLLAVGAIGSDGLSSNSGAVYVFELDTEGTGWNETGRLIASNGVSGDDFGASVAVGAGLVAAGDPDYEGSVPSGGAAYLFERDKAADAWEEIGHAEAEVPDVLAGLGNGVAISGRTLIAGAPFDDNGISLSGQGAAYVFEAIGTGGTLAGVAVTRVTCRNITTGERAGHPEDSGWDCEASGMSVSPGDTLRAQINGTATGEPISGELVHLLVPGVQCRNGATGEIARAPVDAFGKWACDGFSSVPETGDPIVIRLRGFAD